MAKFDIDLVGKVGSLALIDKAYGDINYSTIARISRELRPGMIWVTSGATEIGRLDFIKRTGRELTGSDEDNKTDYSAQGQSVLMGWYRQFVDSRFSLRQILVEHQHFNDAENVNILKSAFALSRRRRDSHHKLQRRRVLRGKPQNGNPRAYERKEKSGGMRR